jgi:hypothetical protein
MESIVASALDMYLGSYVHGLVKENFNLNITRGDLEMENLAIKKEALQDLKLPIVVKSGIYRFYCWLNFLISCSVDRLPWKIANQHPLVKYYESTSCYKIRENIYNYWRQENHRGLPYLEDDLLY